MIRPAVGLKATIEEERGRWILYLDLCFWRETCTEKDLSPLEMIRKRIRDYSTKRDAEIAARWIERTADRGSPHQSLGY